MSSLGSPSRDLNRLDAIEALRGIAALYVLVFHLMLVPRPQLAVPRWAEDFLLAGGSGVTLFFVISAFTLSLSMRSRADEPHALTRFYLRRVFRIVPLFLIWLTIMVLLGRMGFGEHYGWRKILLNLSFLYNFFPERADGIVWASWTLGVEMVFYFLFPLLFRYISNPWRALGFFLFTVMLAGAFRYGLNYVIEDESLRKSFFGFSLFRHLPAFAVGMLLFFIYEHFVLRRILSRAHGIIWISLAGVGYVVLLSRHGEVWGDNAFWQALLYGCLSFGLLISPLGVIVNRAVRFYGEISYSLYLNHPVIIYVSSPVFAWVYAHAWPVSVQYGFCLVLTLSVLTVLSLVTYRFVEKPGMRLGSLLIKNLCAPGRAKLSDPIVKAVV
jgi:peptidoglycan/LPS O-acetylase OafA/YrhL